MRPLRVLLRRLNGLFGKARRDQNLAEEIEFNLQLHIADNVQRGMAPDEARRRAIMELGGVEQTKELYRDQGTLPWLETFVQDLRHGLRLLRKNPGFTLVAVLTLGLGIGVNTAIFSIVDWILLRPMPLPHPEQISVLAFQTKAGNIDNQFSIPDYRDFRDQTTSVFSGTVGYTLGIDGFSVNGKAERILTNYVTGNFFTVLGVQPEAGRLLLPAEGETAGADPVIILGYAYWHKRFNGDPTVIGRKVAINGHPVTIVGVTAKGFHGANPSVDPQAYIPLGMQVLLEGLSADFMSNRGARNLLLLARLRSGVSLRQAEAAFDVVGRRLAQQYPTDKKDLTWRVFAEVNARPHPSVHSVVQAAAALFVALSAMLLLLACLNVANILLVRATIRAREMAIRTALGAARSRLVRQLLTESLLLAVIGALAGLVLGHWSSGALSRMDIHTDLPVNFDFSFDWRVFSYALAAALLTGVVVGIVPALRISRGDINVILHQSGRSVAGAGHRLRSGLVAAQVAGSLMLLIIAGLFTRSLWQVQKVDLGFDASHVVNAAMDPAEVGMTAQQSRQFYRDLLQRVRSLPGVESVSTSYFTPMGYFFATDDLTVDDYTPLPGQPPAGAVYNTISGDYFTTLRIPLVSGRAFTDRDDENAPYVAIVNERFVQRYWPHLNPIGRHLVMRTDPAHSMEVVGVARNSRVTFLTGPYDSLIYIPLAQHYAQSTLQTLQVRTTGDASVLIPEIERTAHNLAPEMPVWDVKLMKEAMETLNGLLMFEIAAGLAAIMGGLGLVLSIVGVFGVISYSAAQRTQEIGIRMALGARPVQIIRMVLRQGVWIVAIGIAIGLACAFALARAAAEVLIVSPTDPLTYVTVSALLTAVALAACYVPARRTLQVDPMLALRNE